MKPISVCVCLLALFTVLVLIQTSGLFSIFYPRNNHSGADKNVDLSPKKIHRDIIRLFFPENNVSEAASNLDVTAEIHRGIRLFYPEKNDSKVVTNVDVTADEIYRRTDGHFSTENNVSKSASNVERPAENEIHNNQRRTNGLFFTPEKNDSDSDSNVERPAEIHKNQQHHQHQRTNGHSSPEKNVSEWHSNLERPAEIHHPQPQRTNGHSSPEKNVSEWHSNLERPAEIHQNHQNHHHQRTNGLFSPENNVSEAAVELDLSAVVHRVDRRFLSVTIDSSLASDERFMSLLSSPKVRTLSSALSPAFVRFGGTSQDFMVFTPHKHTHRNTGIVSCDPVSVDEELKADWLRQTEVLKREEMSKKYKRVTFTESTVDSLNSFSNCTGLDLVFGLNALLRTAGNTWNHSNALSLLQYCDDRGFNMDWELGNEPNSYEKKAGVRVDGDQLGSDFSQLRTLLSHFETFRSSGVFGPDIGQPRDHRMDILDGFLQTGSKAIDAVTWHHYYVNGRDTSLEDFLDPHILDSLALKTQQILQTVSLHSPNKAVMLGETSSAYGGGAPGLSDTFAAGFMWLDKLGLAAKLGLSVVMRQVLIGAGSYHLLDDNMDPLPDYWLSVLYKRLVGQEVLKIETPTFHNKRVRLYLHCTNRHSKFHTRGSVTLISINLSHRPANVLLPKHSNLSTSQSEAFILTSDQSGLEGLYSRSVCLNGEVLKMADDDTLPEFKPASLPGSDRLQLPAFSLALTVYTQANAQACL